jgi:hypothetical protein
MLFFHSPIGIEFKLECWRSFKIQETEEKQILWTTRQCNKIGGGGVWIFRRIQSAFCTNIVYKDHAVLHSLTGDTAAVVFAILFCIFEYDPYNHVQLPILSCSAAFGMGNFVLSSCLQFF